MVKILDKYTKKSPAEQKVRRRSSKKLP